MPFLPYLNFGGSCREAFTRYQEIFGGELIVMGTDEAPPSEDLPPGMDGLVMHAALNLGDKGLLMASDAQPGHFGPVQGMYVSWTVPDVAEGKKIFDQLAEGGKVEVDYAEAFWSPGFGACVDRFGTPWMISVESPAG